MNNELGSRFGIALVLLLAGAGTLRAQNVLVWQPPATTNTFSFTNCAIVGAVLDVRPFSGLTQAQFDAYDIVWVDGGICNFQEATYADVFGTSGNWGPVVDGRVAVTTTDLDFHSSFGTDACAIITNTFDWLADSPGTAMYLSTGCDLEFDTNAPNLTNLDPVFGPSFGLITGGREALLNVPTSGHPTMAGPFTGPTNPTAFGTFCHGAMTAFPSQFQSVASCVDIMSSPVGSAFIVRDESPCFTGFCDPLTTCTYNIGGVDPTCGPCPPGTMGTGTTGCEEIDGCKGDPCPQGLICLDVPAPGIGFQCALFVDGFESGDTGAWSSG